MTSTPQPDAATRAARDERSARPSLGGTHGTELLTSATAVVLIALLAAEGVTLAVALLPATRTWSG